MTPKISLLAVHNKIKLVMKTHARVHRSAYLIERPIRHTLPRIAHLWLSLVTRSRSHRTGTFWWLLVNIETNISPRNVHELKSSFKQSRRQQHTILSSFIFWQATRPTCPLKSGACTGATPHPTTTPSFLKQATARRSVAAVSEHNDTHRAGGGGGRTGEEEVFFVSCLLGVGGGEDTLSTHALITVLEKSNP